MIPFDPLIIIFNKTLAYEIIISYNDMVKGTQESIGFRGGVILRECVAGR